MQDILEYSSIAWPNLRMFGRVPKQVKRPGPIGSRVPPAIPYHDTHSHSPDRLPIGSRNIKNRSNTVDRFQRLLNAETFSDLQSDPPTKTIENGPAKANPYQGPGLLGLTDNPEDPFVGPQSVASRAWRAQVRASSHDISMPDYVSSRRDHSRTHTDMSDVNYPKANFLKHMEEAHPREIVQALSPAQQAQLMRELKAVGTPEQGTHAPSNTPRSLSGMKQPALAIEKVRESIGTRVGSSASSSRQLNDTYYTPDEPKGALRTRNSPCSSNGGQPGMALSVEEEECQPAPLDTSRSRPHSNMSKRKRHSNSVEVETTSDDCRVQVTEHSSPPKTNCNATAACKNEVAE